MVRYCTYYLDHGAPAVCGVVGGVQRVQGAGEDVVVAVGGSQNGVDLLHSQALVEVVQMGAVEVYFSCSRHIDGDPEYVPALLHTLHSSIS
jgi:hypothetical protein